MVPLNARHERRGSRGGGGLLALALLPFLLAAAQVPTPSTETKKPTAPLKLAPRAYFAAHCQRCHGVDGTNVSPGFAKEPLEKLGADIERVK